MSWSISQRRVKPPCVVKPPLLCFLQGIRNRKLRRDSRFHYLYGYGPMPKPRWMPVPQLLYAQVGKSYRRRRLEGVKHRVVFGTRLASEQVLRPCGWTINTACVERLNLALRQRVAAMRRRSATSCKSEDGLGQQLVLFQVYHNFVLPHTSLRQALAEAVPTNGRGSAKVWWSCTPAMAAGLTDHVWSLREVLLYRVPPWPRRRRSKHRCQLIIVALHG